MSIQTIDAALCAKMFLAGAARLDAKKEWINELNVFPVPDGDTGTNMTMTIVSAAKEVSSLEDYSMASLCKAMSSGSLRGARGNSGVILSQLLRGFCKVAKEQEQIDTDTMCLAVTKAVETAYKAVMKPKEGTILTVAREIAEGANELYANDATISLEDLIAGAIERGDDALAKTPEMLPVLKEAGVVDSGGQGLMELMKGAYDVFCGKEVDYKSMEESEQQEKEETPALYCTEFALTLKGDAAKDPAKTGEDLIEGFDPEDTDKTVLVENKLLKVHVHTLHPGRILESTLSLGTLSRVKVEPAGKNHLLTLFTPQQLEELLAAKEEDVPEEARKDVGFVAVAAGDGLCSIFKDLGVDHMIEGGQTMNPSTDDVLNAIEKVHAKTVFVFPNNKNIILAATQAQNLAKDCKVIVIPTKTVPQGITAMISYNPEKSPEENEQFMFQEIANVKTCQLTYSVRDTSISGTVIHEGDIMGVGDKGILAVGEEIVDTAIRSAKQMIDDDTELLSVYYGEDVTEEDAGLLAAKLEEECGGIEVELNSGNQPVYYYIISAE